MTTLRGGFETSDPRLDRIPYHDPRSRNFPVRTLLPKTLRSRSHPSTLWLDQGQEGACVSFSWHHEAGATPVAAKGLTDAIARTRYFDMQRRDEWEGGAYPGASPFYEGTSVLAGAQLLKELGYFKEYRWAFTIDEALLAIAYEGPVIFGIPWLDSMFDIQPDGTLDCSGVEAGGHAIMGRGVVLPHEGVCTISYPGASKRYRIKTTEPLVRLRNSWGKTWGRVGEAFIRASDLERLLKNMGDCCVPIGRAIPA